MQHTPPIFFTFIWSSTSNIEILERFLSKALRMMVDAPWYVPNTVMRRDLKYQHLRKKSTTTSLF
jgi:hypothetical protein